MQLRFTVAHRGQAKLFLLDKTLFLLDKTFSAVASACTPSQSLLALQRNAAEEKRVPLHVL